MAVTVADLLVKLDMDDSDFRKGANNSHSFLTGGFKSLLSSGAMAVGVAAAAGLAAGFNAVKTIEDAMTPVMTVLGKTTPEFKAMSGAIEDVIRISPKSPEEIGSAAYIILSAGITDTTTATLALRDATKLALAGLGSTEEAASIVTSAMNNYKETGLTSTKASEIFFGAILSGKTTLSGLAQGLGGVLPLASGLGVSFEDLMAATSAMTGSGLQASEVYSGIKAGLSNIVRPTKDSEEAAKALGIQWDANALKTHGFSGLLGTLKEPLANFVAGGGNATDVLKDLFGSQEALNIIMGLMGPQAGAYADNLANMATKGQTLNERAKEVSETLSNRLAIAKNVAMLHLSELANKGLDFLTKAWEEHGEKVIAVIDFLKQGFATFKAAFTNNIPQEGDTGGTSGFLVMMQRMGIAARDFVDWFKANWPEIKRVAGEVFSAIGAVFTNVVIPLFQGIVGVVQWAVGIIQENWPKISDIITRVVEIVRGVLDSVITFVKENWPQISEVIKTVGDAIKANLEFMVTYFQFAVGVIAWVWRNFGDEIMAVVGFVFDHIVPFITNALEIVTGVVKLFTSLLKGDWGDAWNALKGIFDAAWDLVWNAITTAFDLLWGIPVKFASWGGELIGKLLGGAKDNVWQLINWVGGLGMDVWDKVMESWNDFKRLGENIIKGMVNGVKNAAHELWNAAWDAVTAPINAIKGWLRLGSPSKLMEQWGAWTVEGFSIGIKNEAKSLNANATGAFGRMASGVSSTAISNTGGSMSVVVNMPPGSNGEDVVNALRRYQERNGLIPVRVAS